MKVSNELIKQIKLEKCSKQSLIALYNLFELNNGVLEQDVKKNKNTQFIKNKKFEFGIGIIEYSTPIKFTKIINEVDKNYVYFDFGVIDSYRAATILSYLKLSAYCFKNSNGFLIHVDKKEKYNFFGTDKADQIRLIQKELKTLGIELKVKVPKRKTKIELQVKNNSKHKIKEEINVVPSTHWYDELTKNENKNNNRGILDGWED